MSKSIVPSEQIQNMLKKRFGHFSEFHQLTEGLSSQAFGFRQGEEDFVIRINRRIEGFQRDAYVSKNFGSPILPVPEVIDIQHLDDSHVYCISRRAPGVRLQDLNETDMQGITSSVVQIMRGIATSNVERTTGFGPYNTYGEGSYRSWNDFLVSVADPRKYDWDPMKDSVNMDLVRKAIERIQSLAQFCPEERKLIHGDFGSFNFLSDGRRITAVIDWDLSMFGDSLYDLANLSFWNEDKMQPVIAALTRQREEPGYQERLQCYQLRIALQEMYQSAMGLNPVDVHWLTTRSMSLL